MRTLYIGLEPSADWLPGRTVIHCPLIKVIPRPSATVSEAFGQLSTCTHLLFTSKSAVRIFTAYYPLFGITQDQLQKLEILALGQKTAEEIRKQGLEPAAIASTETAEGVIEAFESKFTAASCTFWPHSGLSRDVLPRFFQQRNLSLIDCVLYDTIPLKPDPLPSLTEIDEIVFTSPSTIDAFLEAFGAIPKDKKLTCIGPITQRHLEKSIIDT